MDDGGFNSLLQVDVYLVSVTARCVGECYRCFVSACVTVAFSVTLVLQMPPLWPMMSLTYGTNSLTTLSLCIFQYFNEFVL